jgi:ubiquinone/menaquinone biosynthesis C-methylase UbiE
MSQFEVAFCRSAPWRSFTRRVVLPWALQGFAPEGEVLEIGAGSGAMAEQLLLSFASVKVLTATDYDQKMVDTIAARLAPFRDRGAARQADATALPFDDDTFDVALSWIMLHHTVEWEKALSELMRVVHPGGHVVGYDLVSAGPLQRLHRAAPSRVRMMQVRQLRDHVATLPVEQALITPSVGGVLVRFLLRKGASR